MSTHAVTGHNSHRAPPRRRLRLLPPWRRPAAAPEAHHGEHPYPPLGGIPASFGEQAKPPEPAVWTAAAPVPAAFTGASLGLPDDTGTLAAIRADAVPETVRLLQQVRDGLRDLDKPAPLAFARLAEQDGGFGEYWPLDGEPAFLGLGHCGDRQVAEVTLGCQPDGRPWIFAGDAAEIDARIAVLMVARDRLVYGSGPAPAAGPPAAPEEAAGQEDQDGRTARRAESLAACWGVWRRAVRVPAAGDVPDAVQDAVQALDDALGVYGQVVNGIVHWHEAFPDLRGMPDPEDAAAEAAIGRALDARQRVIDAVAAGHGQDTADSVAGIATAHPPVPVLAPEEEAGDGGPGAEDEGGPEPAPEPDVAGCEDAEAVRGLEGGTQ